MKSELDIEAIIQQEKANIFERAEGLRKLCVKCKELLPLTSFCKNIYITGGLNHTCKSCASIYQRNYHRLKHAKEAATNTEKRKALIKRFERAAELVRLLKELEQSEPLR